MKYLPLLLLIFCLSCVDKSSNRQAANAADSVLHTPLLQPLTDSILRFPDHADLYFRRGLLLFNTHPLLAQADFEKAAAMQPAVTDHWAGAGEAALVNERYDTAAIFFEKALHTMPGNAYLQYRLAMAWVESGQYGRADSLATVLEKQPEAYAQAFYLKARMAEDRKDTLGAIAHLKTAVEAAGVQSEYEAVMELAGLLRATRAANAARYYELAYRQDSVNAEPLYEMGQYYEELGKTKEATATYKRCIVADPDYAAAYTALGKLGVRHRQWKSALAYFSMAARASPTDAEAYYYRGLCHEQLGDKNAALSDYAKALSFRKEYPEARAAWDKLSR
ncbi:tetratricopeptide repeat protein [Chitinophaga japonensis]|uniref:Tetratricopeptide repeat protein n=1 Tax=Chitinophaga japonensis TaxID=104662 RepID=A0A562T6E7_CHIJA|nr:tetratricopeptide repeat protein [Chitinophaga japonensis]TWI89121.1 tetratricopeptide repeat protein [Chitinophaga japonensis]